MNEWPSKSKTMVYTLSWTELGITMFLLFTQMNTISWTSSCTNLDSASTSLTTGSVRSPVTAITYKELIKTDVCYVGNINLWKDYLRTLKPPTTQSPSAQPASSSSRLLPFYRATWCSYNSFFWCANPGRINEPRYKSNAVFKHIYENVFSQYQHHCQPYQYLADRKPVLSHPLVWRKSRWFRKTLEHS